MSRASDDLRMAPPLEPDVGRVSVLYLIDSLGPGGAEHLLAEYLGVLPRLGVEASVVALQEREGNPVSRRIESHGVEVSTLGIARLRQRGALSLVDGAIRDAAPDVVHTQLEFSNILGSAAAHRRGIPVVSTIHTIDRPSRWSRDGLRFRLMAWSLRRRADRVLCVSDGARRHFRGVARLPRDRVTTLFNGIHQQPFQSPPADARTSTRTALGIDDEAPVAVTVAVLRQPKGIQHMLRAFRSVLRDLEGARYLIVGDGPYRAELEALTADLGIAHAVHFTGATDRVSEHLAASDVFVLPSLTEGLPTVLIEAMAAGLPVVASGVGGIPEMVDAGVSGLLVPPADPARLADTVGRLLESPLQGRAMGLAGRRIAAERFDIDRQAASLVEEYRLAMRRRVAR